MSAILELAIWLCVAASVRSIYLTIITFYQRNGLRLAIRGRLGKPVDIHEWNRKFELYREVSFDTHFLRLITFRNPWSAYSDDLAEDIEEAK